MFVGEVGLDSRGSAVRQREVLTSVLDIAHRHNVIVSLHSSGRSAQIVELLEQHPLPGAVLHWFTGGPDLIQRAVDVGADFSVNSSAKDDVLAALPQDRVLTETDYPATKRSGSRLPAHVVKIEARLGSRWATDEETLRRTIWRNLRRLATASGTLDRFPRDVAQTLISA
jgi:TatD DNase family protein